MDAEVDCAAPDKTHPAPYIRSGHVHVEKAGFKFDARTDDGKKGDITGVAFLGNGDAIVAGTYAGSPFSLTLHDAGQPKGQYGAFAAVGAQPHGNVHFALA